jgi:hypothetical protein
MTRWPSTTRLESAALISSPARIAQAAQWQERALSEHPSAFWVHRTLCPTYLHANAKLQARRSLGMLRVRYPGLTLEQVRLGMPPLQPAHGDLIAGGLAEAGLGA